MAYIIIMCNHMSHNDTKCSVHCVVLHLYEKFNIVGIIPKHYPMSGVLTKEAKHSLNGGLHGE